MAGREAEEDDDDDGRERCRLLYEPIIGVAVVTVT